MNRRVPPLGILRERDSQAPAVSKASSDPEIRGDVLVTLRCLSAPQSAPPDCACSIDSKRDLGTLEFTGASPPEMLLLTSMKKGPVNVLEVEWKLVVTRLEAPRILGV
ncbi:hypothetical protein NDU88_006408 [Pleurodeles waltl]|uniref:Uncharacterized protein n=1 Tax=Pleurodeles waltl TaxID=8319 RepID=A0AAV7TXK3_PLEWA|nr:hypothetical protein NDU88_006408 [Pleurodeles waltl]